MKGRVGISATANALTVHHQQLVPARSLSEILQILSLTQFEKTPVVTVSTASTDQNQEDGTHKQLLLFDF